MVNFDLLIQRQQFHSRLHTLRIINFAQFSFDSSCPICYPEYSVASTPQFINFWYWFSTEYPVSTFTSNTKKQLERLINSTQTDSILGRIEILILSIRYTQNPGSYITIRQDIYNALVSTNGFQRDPFEVLYQISETAQSTNTQTTTSLSNTPSVSTRSNTPDPLDGEDFNLDLLFQIQVNMANQQDIQNLTAAVQGLAGLFAPQGQPAANNGVFQLINNLQANAQAINGNPQRRETRVVDLPYFYGGNQDPIGWLEEFTRACNANGINDNRKIEVVPAYLKNSASTWWTTNQALNNGNANRIVAWTGNNNNTDFIQNFPAAFRSQTLMEIWTTELEKRRQQPGESVDDYACALSELYRRVETQAFQYPNAMKARRLVSGLLPELHLLVKPFNDQTWNDALNRAKQYELTYKDTNAVEAYMNKYANPSGNTGQLNALNAAIANLSQQIQQMNIGGRKYNSGYRQNNYQQQNYQQNNNQQNRPPRNNQSGPIVCFDCGQPGHIRRNCPTRIVNDLNNPNNNIAVNNPPVQNNPNPVNTVTANLANNISTNNNINQNNNAMNVHQAMQLLTQLLEQENNNNQDQHLN